LLIFVFCGDIKALDKKAKSVVFVWLVEWMGSVVGDVLGLK
jgi:hypothetical protein